MKLRALAIGLALPCALAGYETAWAGNGSDRGGGSSLTLIDGSVVLADPFLRRSDMEGTFHCKPGERGDLAPALVEALHQTGLFLVRLGAAKQMVALEGDSRSNTPVMNSPNRSSFIEEAVLAPDIEYCFVASLPHDHPMTLEDSRVPQFAELGVYGYTEGRVTWLRADLFKRMDIMEQVKAIVHERLHAVAGNVPHGPIADVIGGVETVLGLAYMQAHGFRGALTDAQLISISKLYEHIDNLNLNRGSARELGDFPEHYRIVPNGGGLVHRNVSVAPDAYVGVGSVVGGEVSRIGSKATLLNSRFCSASGKGAVVDPMKRIDAGASMLNSSLPFCGKYAILEYHADMVESVVAMEIANRDSGWEKKVDYMQGGFWMARGALLNNAYLLFFGGINVYTGSIIANVHAAAFTHNASVVQLEVGAHTAFADFDGGFIAPIKLSSVAWFSSFEPAMPRIQIAPGKVVDFKHSLICPRASAEVRDIGQVADGTHKVSSVAEMQDEFCKYY